MTPEYVDFDHEVACAPPGGARARFGRPLKAHGDLGVISTPHVGRTDPSGTAVTAYARQ
ncbi:hypothetical protein [Streptomyces sp. OP7]|uniref:hypothetical protein n=1 Tax=Streptomyces sp. OP7 TaxID=3142462 RepID=UPI0032E8D170